MLETFPEIGDRYKEFFLAADIKQAKLGIVLLILPIILFLFNDYLFFGLSLEFYGLTAERLVYLTYTILFFAYLNRLKSYRQYCRSEFAWGLTGMIVTLTVSASRPQNFLFHIIFVIIIVFVTCLVIPQTFVNRIILSLTLTIGELAIIVMGTSSIALAALFSVVFSLAMANIIGLSMSRLLESYRERAFGAQEEISHLASFPVLNPDPVFEADLTGKICYTNAAAEKTFPDLKGAGKGHPLLSDWDQIIQKTQANPENSFDREIDINHHWFNEQVYLMPNIQKVRAYITPIDERKKAEEAFRETKNYLDNLLNYANAPIIVWDNEQKISLFNGAFEALTGYNKEFMLGKNIDMLFPPSQKAEILQTIEKATQGEKWESLEVPILCKDGQTRIALWNSANIQDKDGNIVATIAQGQDITERNQAEKILRESEEKYRRLVEHLQEGIWTIDKDSCTTFVNSRMAEILGYTVDEMQGKPLFGFMDKRGIEIAKRLLERRAQGIKEQHEDGSRIYVALETSPINDSNGKYIGALAGVMDVTERRKAEQALKESRDKLELMNEKLRVVGGLSRHDVCNKLSAVTGYAYLLKKTHSDQADIVDGLGKVEQAVKDSVKIFDFARMYEQLGVEELTYVDVETAVDEAVALFSGFNLKVVTDCRGLSVLADSFLRQLFYNFIDNTRKYGKKATTIKVHYEKAESGDLKLIYEDDGVGISRENKIKLFKEGFSTGGSTGFGLFLIRKMMDVYGWQIREVGEPGKGAKFTITIQKLNKNGKEDFQITSESNARSH